MNRKDYCVAYSAKKTGLKSRIAIPHTCGRDEENKRHSVAHPIYGMKNIKMAYPPPPPTKPKNWPVLQEGVTTETGFRVENDSTVILPDDIILKPPIGLMPQWLWIEKRRREILRAIARYKAAGWQIPKKWYKELAKHEKAIERHKNRRK